MKIGVFGTGQVGQIISEKLAELGHDVMIGTRDVAKTQANVEPHPYGYPAFSIWQKEHASVKLGTYAEAAKHAEVVFNATNGTGTLDALKLAGESNLNGKVLIDIANPLDFSQGYPPSLFVSNTDSLGEQIQRAYPDAKVIKTLNTVTAALMVNPGLVANADHTMFICGNDADAKTQVTEWLKVWFGWKDVIDLGDITNSRGTEQVLSIWIRLLGVLGTGMFNFKVVK
ncbi:MAG: NAD(P)-binding domain-containing protein [Chloroflexota bacterium]